MAAYSSENTAKLTEKLKHVKSFESIKKTIASLKKKLQHSSGASENILKELTTLMSVAMQLAPEFSREILSKIEKLIILIKEKLKVSQKKAEQLLNEQAKLIQEPFNVESLEKTTKNSNGMTLLDEFFKKLNEAFEKLSQLKLEFTLLLKQHVEIQAQIAEQQKQIIEVTQQVDNNLKTLRLDSPKPEFSVEQIDKGKELERQITSASTPILTPAAQPESLADIIKQTMRAFEENAKLQNGLDVLNSLILTAEKRIYDYVSTHFPVSIDDRGAMTMHVLDQTKMSDLMQRYQYLAALQQQQLGLETQLQTKAKEIQLLTNSIDALLTNNAPTAPSVKPSHSSPQPEYHSPTPADKLKVLQPTEQGR